MKTPFFAAALLLSTPAVVIAQGDAPAAEQQDPQAAYRKLVGEFNQAMSAWQEDLEQQIQAAKDGGPRVPRAAYQPPTKEFVATAQEHARQFDGKPEALQFLGFIVKYARSERNAVKWALGELATDHFDGVEIGELADYLPNAARLARSEASKLLFRLADEHGDAGVRATALMVRARALAPQDSAAALRDLDKVGELSKDEDLLAEAQDLRDQLQKFAIGAQAPDIVGEDIDGVAFKLSDYRGKVVLLDFWGFW